MSITTQTLAERLATRLVDQGVALEDATVFAEAFAGDLTEWLGGEGAVPAALASRVTATAAAWNTDVMQRLDWWTGPADGGPNGDGLYPMINAAGVETMFPSLAKILDSTAKGNPGWTAKSKIEPDGATRAVVRILDWVGGEGAKPATGYIAEDGSLVGSAAAAYDFFGPISTTLTGLKVGAEVAKSGAETARDSALVAQTNLETLRGVVIGMANVPSVFVGGQEVQPTAMSFDLYVIEGYYVATAKPYRPIDPLTEVDAAGSIPALKSATSALVNCPTIMIAGREVQPTELSFDLYVVRGKYLDTGLTYDPLNPVVVNDVVGNTSVLLTKTTGLVNCPPVTVGGREVQPTELSFDLCVVRGTYLDTGEAYDPLAPVAPLDPAAQRVVALNSTTIDCPPVTFGGRLLQPLELSFDLYVQRGVYLDTGEYYEPFGAQASEGGLVVIQTPTKLRVFRKGSNPASNHFIEHQFENDPDPSKNSDVWRLNGDWDVVRVGAFEFTRVQQITNPGERERAIQEQGALDFMGGNAHGNEEKFATAMVVDDILHDINQTLAFTCDKLEFFQASKLYKVGNPDKYTPKGPVAANSYCRWIFEPAGVDVSTELQWQMSMTLAITYLAMMPVWRVSETGAQITTTGMKSPTWALEDISTSSHPGTQTKAAIIKAWGSTGYGVQMEMLDGWDKPNRQSRISNSVSPAYNKLYFDITGSGYVTAVNEVMRARFRFTINTTN
ncbi:hypothetical protein [Caulobacter sp. BP25]|uniref:hypothetical protein n=1 Tax=Caulobacter sp. BP25 TaxID=2048900 RepID=UPI000C12CD1F|nr:hypothetical protein [Caulobacter sp. BP25]PHY20936.1 hypothetical protein CSW59_06930 [Caulobacter sp. BP25]